MVIVPIVRPIMAIVTAAGIMATATSVIAKEEETVEPPERPIGTRVQLLHGVPNRGVPFVSRIRSFFDNSVYGFDRNHKIASSKENQKLLASLDCDNNRWIQVTQKASRR